MCDGALDEVEVPELGNAVLETAEFVEQAPAKDEVCSLRRCIANLPFMILRTVDVQERPDSSPFRDDESNTSRYDVGTFERIKRLFQPVRLRDAVDVAEGEDRS